MTVRPKMDCAANTHLEPGVPSLPSTQCTTAVRCSSRHETTQSTMWNRCVKAAVGRVFPPRCCVKPSARLKTARIGSNRATSTASDGGQIGELAEPDTKVLETLVCPFSKVRYCDRQNGVAVYTGSMYVCVRKSVRGCPHPACQNCSTLGEKSGDVV